jgi:parvulin-like peptidyl-prolyl isomerase
MTTNRESRSDSVSVPVKKLGSTLIILLSLGLAVSLVGTSCAAVSPTALSVGSWSLSDSDLTSQMSGFADVYGQANGSAADLHGADGSSWATSFTSAFLNDQLTLQLARLDVAERGLTITDADRQAAQQLLEQNFTSSKGQGGSYFSKLDATYRQNLIEGVAAQNVLVTVLRDAGMTDEALRRVYDASGDKYKGTKVCASHILIFAGTTQGQSTPTDADYATALAKIQVVQAQLTGTSNFADLAKTNSDDTGSGAQGGDLGCNDKGSFVGPFDDAAWNQPVGIVGPPVKTIYGYHLILVTARGDLTFDEVKTQIATSLKNDLRSLLDAELARMAGTVSIGVDGRYGRYVSATGTIVAPAGATPPSTLVPNASMSGSGQPTSGTN